MKEQTRPRTGRTVGFGTLGKTMPVRRMHLTLLGLSSLAVLLGWSLGETPDAVPTLASTAPTGQGAAAGDGSAGTTAGPGRHLDQWLALRQRQWALWQAWHAQAEAALDNYRHVTRYPAESRPLEEHPDQLRPFEPAPEFEPARDAFGKPIKGLRIRSTQGPSFLGGNESTVFTIAAVNDQNEVISLRVTDAVARAIADTAAPALPIAASLHFNDNGSDGDAVASDGTYSARFTPAQQGFASYTGTVRVMAEVSVASQNAVVPFDLVYAPEVPATWLGVRDGMEDGSLSFYLKLQAKLPGAYVVSARVFDANGVPLALLQVQQTVSVGVQELKLPLFGGLIRDYAPVFPLRLVDVEGYLFRPDAFPDRLMLARQHGVVHTTGRYAPESFSSAEWRNDVRELALRQYSLDAQEAAQHLKAMQGP